MRTIFRWRKSSLRSLLRLEDRVTPATFSVTNTGDGTDSLGNPFSGSLRWAITQGNDSMTWGPGPHTIEFNLPGTAYTIALSSALPASLYPVTVNGRSQPGYAGTPLVEITGTSTGDGIVALAGNCAVRGLIINGCPNGNAIYLSGSGNVVEGCYLGTDRTGSLAVPNGWGIRVDAAESCTIGGSDPDDRNIISGNVVTGVMMSATGVGNNKIVGNYIGTDVTGMLAVPNAGGLTLSGPGYTIGGATSNLRNVISGNTIDGVTITSSILGFVQGNFIGTNALGTVAVPNGGYGLQCDSSANYLIGGAGTGEGNLIAGNLGSGLGVTNCGPSTTIYGNTIGAALDGKTALGNGGSGIQIHGSAKVQVGGTAGGQSNIVSANGVHGIAVDFIDFPSGFGVTIQGNMIGVDKAGISSLGNKSVGVFLLTAKNCVIGGTAAGAGNVISANNEGIFFGFNFPFGVNTIQGNTIGATIDHLPLAASQKTGVHIFGSAGNQVGGLMPGAGNFIAGNTERGLVLEGGTFGNAIEGNTIAYNGVDLKLKGHGIVIDSGTKNRISRNSIHDNAGRGIDLRKTPGTDDGFTVNDTYATAESKDGDPDTGANDLQDYPVVVARTAADAHKGVHTWRISSKPGTQYTIEFFQNTAADPSGFGEGETFLDSKTVVTDTYGNADIELDHAGKTFISATATDPLGNTSEFSMVDTDADGLADAWETGGIDVNEDGIVDLTLKSSAVHRDLFVEVDVMQGIYDFPTIKSAVADVVTAFGNAPNSLIHNPDNMAGVLLHASLDAGSTDTDIAIDKTWPGDHWNKFQLVKDGAVGGDGRDGKFGSADDRNPLNLNWPNIRAARRLVYRYGMFAYDFDGGSSGVAELARVGGSPTVGPSFGGNDFMVTLGKWNVAALTTRDFAGTFMHELGHTLNIRHGGGDDDNRKPNYHSVMSYNWQIPTNMFRRLSDIDDIPYNASLRLDYSQQAFDTLNENAMLDENVGVTAPGGLIAIYAGKSGPYGSSADIGAKPSRAYLATYASKTDWNRLNGNSEIGISADINFDGSTTTLAGHEDWTGVQYFFAEARLALPGQNPGAGEDPTEDPEVPAQPPRVVQVTINNGSVQRSRITSVTVDFDDIVTLPTNPADAFTLVRQSDSMAVTLSAAVVSDVHTHVTLTFAGGPVDFGSLADGRYTLTVLGTQVTSAGGPLDGDGNGTGGDNYVLASASAPSPPTNIWRLFGDADGSGQVTSADFLAFRLAFLSASPVFDFDNSGSVDSADFLQFRLRFLQTI